MSLKSSEDARLDWFAENPDLQEELRSLVVPFQGKQVIRKPVTSHQPIGFEQFEPVPDRGIPAEDFLSQLTQTILPQAVHTASPYYMGHMSPVLPSIMAPLAEVVTAMNQNNVKLETSGVLTNIERQAIAMLHQQIYRQGHAFYAHHAFHPESTLGIACSGGTVANLTAMWCARSSAAAFTKPIKVICSRMAHYSIEKAVNLLGIGQENLVRIPVGPDFKIDLFLLEQALKKYSELGHPLILIGVAGSTECGSIDPLIEMAQLATTYRAFFHVDAAWGGPLLLSESNAALLRGIDLADSVTIDAHKQLCTPLGLGLVFFKDAQLASAIEHSARYIIRRGSPDLGRRSVEGSRPANALYLQAALRLLGKSGFDQLLTRGIQNAKLLADIIRASDDFELLAEPEMNILLYRYLPISLRESRKNPTAQEAINAFNQELQKRQFAAGQTFVSRTTVPSPSLPGTDIVVLRAVFVNPHTQQAHMEAMLENQRSISQSMTCASVLER